MKTKQKVLIDNGILIGVGMFMYIQNKDRMLQITGQMKQEEIKPRNEWVVTIDEESHLCQYSKTNEILSVNYKEGSANIKSSWNFGDKIFNGEINGKKISDLKIIKEDRIGNYIIEHDGSEFFITIRSPKASEFEKMIVIAKASLPKEKVKVKEMIDKVDVQAVNFLDEQIAVAIAVTKAKNNQ